MRLRAAVLPASFSWRWLIHLGGPGLILIGIVDNSFIPIPGGMDLMTIILAANRKELWWYYALMATVGSVIGGFLTYRLGEKGGEETLQKKVPKSEIERVYRIFKKFGFWSVFAAAIAPPPVPIVPFTLAPGVLEYSKKRFLIALGSGRLLRYMVVAYLGSRFGQGVFHWLTRYYKPVLFGIIALGVAAGISVIVYVKQRKRARASQKRSGKRSEKRVA
jgi:membrane protein YqaA with SNARE-associated domain